MFTSITNVTNFCRFLTVRRQCMMKVRGEKMIKIATILIIVFLVMILFGTLMIAGKSDPGYGKKAKNTTVTISVIYLSVGILAVAGIAAYVYFS